MTWGDTVKGTPNWILYSCATVILITLIGSFTILAWGGKDATELRSLVNTLLNIAAVLLSSGGAVLAGLAAKKSTEAAENTNGKMQQTIATAIHDEVHSSVPQAVANVLSGDTEVKTNGRPDV